MDPSLDPITRRQIEEFHRQLDTTKSFYQEAALLLARDRLMRELEALREPQKPKRLVPLGRRVVAHIVNRIRHRLPHHHHGRGEDYQDGASVIIIDPGKPGSSVVVEQVQAAERNWIDV